MTHGAPGSNNRRNILVVAAFVLMVSLTAGGIKWQQSLAQQVVSPKSSLSNGEEAERYAANPGLPGAGIGGESGELHSIEDYWLTRIGYPTGNFNTQWVIQAAKQDAKVQEKVPAGRVTYNSQDNPSPLALNPNGWTSLGPQPENEPPYGHTSGRVNDIVIDPVISTTAYLATVGGGIWKTTNCCTAATTFTSTLDDPLVSTSAIDDLSIDPNNPSTIYAGTGDLNFGSFSMGSIGVLKSTDSGNTWAVKGADVFGFSPVYPQPVGNYPQYQAIGKVEADPNNSNIVVAGTKTGIYISYNGGDNWTGPCYTNPYSANERQDTTGLILSDAGATTDMYVAVGTRGYSTTVQINLAENGANGIYKASVPTSGCPANWNLSSRPDNGWPAGTGSGIPVYQSGGDTLGRIDLAIAPSNPNYVYAVVQSIANPGGILGVWRTTDAGVTWQQTTTSTGFPSPGCSNSPGNQQWYNQHITVDPNNPDVVLVDTIDIYKSINGGTLFTNITCAYTRNLTHPDQHAITYAPGSSSTLMVGNDGGAYVSLDANSLAPSFSQLNDSLNTIEFYAGDITSNFATSSAPGANAGAQDNGSSVVVYSGTVGPALWTQRNGGDGMYARIEPVFGQRWYQESQNGNVRVSTTGPFGALANATGGWTADSPRLSFVMPYEIYKGTPNNPATDCPDTAPGCTHMIAGSYRVWETVQGAVPRTSWYANSPDLTKNTLADRSFINQLSYAVNMSTTVIAGTNDGNVWYGFGMGQGIADTATWVNVTGGNAILPNRPIQDVATDPLNGLIGYAGIGGFDQNTPSTPGHVYKVTCTSNCGSFTWENKSGNLPNIPVDSIIANPNFPQQVFAGTDWGFYYTDNINATPPAWYHFNNGIPNVMIWDMSIDRGSTTLAAFTRGRGAYVWPLPSGPLGGPTVTPTSATTSTATAATTSTRTSTAVASGTSTSVATGTGTVGSTITAVATFTPAATNTAGPSATSTTVPPTACPIQFQDVASDNTFYPYVRCLACRGILGGYPCGGTGEPCGTTNNPYFRPGVQISRGQIAKIVSQSAGFNEAPGNQIYEDVPTASPFYDYINRLSNRGYIGGYPCGQLPSETCITPNNRPYFRPSSNATRGQLSKIVATAAMITDPVSGQIYTDVGTDSPFYKWIQQLSARNVMSGYPCGGAGEPCDSQNRPYFRPNADVTRGQASKIVANTFFPNCNTPALPGATTRK